MFTGIVEEIGEVLAVRESAEVVVLTVRGRAVTTDAAHGDSIAVNGVCLTVIDTVLDPGAARTGRSPWSWCPRRSSGPASPPPCRARV